MSPNAVLATALALDCGVWAVPAKPEFRPPLPVLGSAYALELSLLLFGEACLGEFGGGVPFGGSGPGLAGREAALGVLGRLPPELARLGSMKVNSKVPLITCVCG